MPYTLSLNALEASAQKVNVAGKTFHFTKDETIHTENCYKYTLDGFDAIAANAHFKRHGEWMDPQELFVNCIMYVKERL